MVSIKSSDQIRDMSIVNIERFAGRYAQTRGCWVWYGSVNKAGYGVISVYTKNKKGPLLAHRIMYELLNGYTPYNYVDHLCRNRRCVNPKHLELVTPRENTLRGEGIASVCAKKTVCINGHEFTKENTYIRPDRNHRECYICRKNIQKKANKRRKSK